MMLALTQLKREMQDELNSILAWWQQHMVDHENKGFYGRMSGDNKLYPESDKGVILNTRILWTYSRAAFITKNNDYKIIADRAYNYIVDHFLDKENGGLYWMLDYKGSPTQAKKQIYAQSFGIYAFSEYYKLTKKKVALDHANHLFQLIEMCSRDSIYNGYYEAFTENWLPIEDLRLSAKDENEAKTMNTHLHILEAYTNLFKVSGRRVYFEPIKNLIKLFLDKFIHPESKQLILFFDEKWQAKSNTISYGHDIECSWLLHEAAMLLNEELLAQKISDRILEMAQVCLTEAIDESGSLIYETEYKNSKVFYQKEKHWWVQAEAVIGFFNAYEISTNNDFLIASHKCWNYIQDNILDKENGEWVWSRLENGQINTADDKAGSWKAPYHNGRMCMELIERIDKIS